MAVDASPPTKPTRTREPIEVRLLAAELPSQARFEVYVRPLSNVPATEAKALASIVNSALLPSLILSRDPRTLVQLIVQALSPSRGRGDVSGMMAPMINAAPVVFLNAGSVPLNGIISAMAVVRKMGGELAVDPGGGRGGGGHRVFRVPYYAGLASPWDYRVMCAHVLEGRVSRVEWSDDLVRATELTKGATLVIADEMRGSVFKMGMVPALVFEGKEGRINL